MTNTTTTPYAIFTQALYQTTGQTPNEKGMFCCPAHEDSNPSLSVSEGDDGRVLVKCFAGCDAEPICNAVGLELKDLMPANIFRSNGSVSQPKATNQPQQQAKGKKAYPDALTALKALEQQIGRKHSARWAYHNPNGKHVAGIVRFDMPDGSKTFRPIIISRDGWVIGAMPAPNSLLYHLPDLKQANRVYICEGEKAVDAARSIGLVVTTSAGGSGAAKKTNWKPLAGKEIIILPDNDEPGDKYANDVCDMLWKLEPRPTIKIVTLPDLPDKGDIFDWLEERDAKPLEELKAVIEQLANDAKLIEPVTTEPIIPLNEEYQPFPADCLPYPLNELIKQGSNAIGCDSSYIALPLLSALAASIGNSTSLQIQTGWNVPCILWTAVVGESGTAKSPAFKLVMSSLRKIEWEAMQQYQVEMAEWQSTPASKDEEKPPEPTQRRSIIDDATIEAVAPIFLSNQCGLLLANDELNAWFNSFCRYKKSNDSPHWLKMFNAENFTVDRKTGEPKTIMVRRASMSICGGIQPGILRRALSEEHRESGLASRFLFAYPPRKQKRFNKQSVNQAIKEAYGKVIEELRSLESMTDRYGNNAPQLLKLSKEAESRFEDHYNKHNEEQQKLTGDISAAWSKLEETPARLAIIIHCVRHVTGDKTLNSFDVVDDATMYAASKLTEWFKAEARRVYAMLNQEKDQTEHNKLISFIKRKGEAMTIRDVQQSCSWLKTSDQTERELIELVQSGLGEWLPVPSSPKGGRPTRKFQLL